MSITQNTPSGQDAKIEEYDLLILGGGNGWNSRCVDFANKGPASQ